MAAHIVRLCKTYPTICHTCMINTQVKIILQSNPNIRYLRKIPKHLNSCIWPSPCHNSTFAVPRAPGWALILAKMGAFLAVTARLYGGQWEDARFQKPL